LITRSGDTWSPGDLKRVNCGGAATVIVVDDPMKSEYFSMTLAFAASAQRESEAQSCIVQVRNLAMKAIIERATRVRGPPRIVRPGEDPDPSGTRATGRPVGCRTFGNP